MSSLDAVMMKSYSPKTLAVRLQALGFLTALQLGLQLSLQLNNAHAADSKAVNAKALTQGQTKPRPDPAIQKEIDRLILQFGDGLAEPYSERPAIVVYGQIFDESKKDAVVIFNLEGFGGGNHHAEYIAFFAAVPSGNIAGKISRPYRLVAVTKLGERGWRSFDFNTALIKDRTVMLSGVEMGPKDGLCCPSVAIKRIFYVDEADHIVETDTPPSAASRMRYRP
ncbi:hypothetical protein [Undibacterium sp. TJN19]|uniref:hypothetical protein n=1 Tax=Undibacterium sp. TJN19 TaxID=3413055 RepID=UPI003BF2B2AA